MQSNTSGQISLKNTNRYKAMRLPTPSCFKIDTRFNASDLKHYQTDYYEIERRIEIVCMYEIEIPRQIGQSIKSKKLKKGFTQEQLAKLSNTSRSLVYRLEKGTTNGISLDKLFGILRTLDLELSIIDLDDESKNTGQDTTDSEGHGNHKIKKRPSALTANNAAGKNDSSRNSRAQRKKELRAIQNIKALNAQMNSKG